MCVLEDVYRGEDWALKTPSANGNPGKSLQLFHIISANC